MRAVSVFPLDEFRLALKKVYGAAAPKGPFTALSQATLFFSRNSCTIACCNHCCTYKQETGFSNKIHFHGFFKCFMMQQK